MRYQITDFHYRVYSETMGLAKTKNLQDINPLRFVQSAPFNIRRIRHLPVRRW